MKTSERAAAEAADRRTSDAEATPVMSSETTSGITVIRMAFTHSVPIGATASAARMSVALCDAPMARPAASADAEGDENPRAFFHDAPPTSSGRRR